MSPIGFLAKLLLGDGTLSPEMLAALESEGLVLVEQGLSGSVSYSHFKAPGRRFNGKITPERIGLGLSEQRLVAYCRSGKVKLIDTQFDNPRLDAVTVELQGDEKVAFKIDYDLMGEPGVSGVITVRVKTDRAAEVVGQLQARLEG